MHIQKLVKWISKVEKHKKRLIHVYGATMNGKMDVVNYACRHAMDGRVNYFHAAINVNLSNDLKQEIFTNHSVRDAVKNKLSSIKGISGNYNFDNAVSNKRFLFVIDGCQDFIDSDSVKFN